MAQKAEGDGGWCLSGLSLALFIQPMTLVQVQGGLPFSVKPIWKHPHRQPEVCLPGDSNKEDRHYTQRKVLSQAGTEEEALAVPPA